MKVCNNHTCLSCSTNARWTEHLYGGVIHVTQDTWPAAPWIQPRQPFTSGCQFKLSAALSRFANQTLNKKRKRNITGENRRLILWMTVFMQHSCFVDLFMETSAGHMGTMVGGGFFLSASPLWTTLLEMPGGRASPQQVSYVLLVQKCWWMPWPAAFGACMRTCVCGAAFGLVISVHIWLLLICLTCNSCEVALDVLLVRACVHVCMYVCMCVRARVRVCGAALVLFSCVWSCHLSAYGCCWFRLTCNSCLAMDTILIVNSSLFVVHYVLGLLHISICTLWNALMFLIKAGTFIYIIPWKSNTLYFSNLFHQPVWAMFKGHNARFTLCSILMLIQCSRAAHAFLKVTVSASKNTTELSVYFGFSITYCKQWLHTRKNTIRLSAWRINAKGIIGPS